MFIKYPLQNKWLRSAGIFVYAISTPLLTSQVSAADQTADQPTVIDDATIRKELTDGVGKLVDAKKTTDCKILTEQLKRESYALKLPEPSTEVKKNLYKDCAKSVVAIATVYKCPNCNHWHNGGAATAWILTEDGVMVTNYHVFEGKTLPGFGIRTFDGRIAPVVEILAASKKNDVVLFRVEGHGFTPLPLGPTPQVGSDIHLIAHPDSRFYTYTSGKVSRYYKKHTRHNTGNTLMAVTADFARGSSGGPIMDSNGNVVGMVSSTQSIYYPPRRVADKKGPFQMVIHNCVTVESIRSLIKTEK